MGRQAKRTAGCDRARQGAGTLFGLVVLLAFGACAGAGIGSTPAPDPAAPPVAEAGAERIEVILLHMNDVYEITPIEGGAVGGLARVATLRDRLLEETPYVVLTHGGDMFSPSAMGTAVVDGERLAGEQMVDVLDRVGLDWATFGNHEFDVTEAQFRERLAESDFGWVSANVTAASGEPFPGVVETTVLTFGDPGGPSFRLGVVGGTLRSGDPDWVRVTDPLLALATAASELAPRVDAVLALTHLDLDEDVALAETVPSIDLVLGGHEHENWAVHRGDALTPVLKADANVRTVFVVRLAWEPATGGLSIDPDLVPITDAIAEDPEVAAVVARWVDLAYGAFREQGFDPDEPVAVTTDDLDGRSSVVRNQSNTLTDLVAEAMLRTAPDADAAVFNSGSIRIDDVLPAGRVTQYDVIRVLPFGGDIVEVEIAGGLLRRVLDQGVENRGTGGFLQHAGITRSEQPDGSSAWTVGGAPLSEARTYRVALTDFLLTGRETGLDYLMLGHPDLQRLGSGGDIRMAVIAELERRYGAADR